MARRNPRRRSTAIPALRRVHPEVVRRFLALKDNIEARGARVRVTSGFRTLASQRRLFELRRAGRWPFPVAPPGMSTHNYGLAIDAIAEPFRFHAEGDQPQLLFAIAPRFGLHWGGVEDAVHLDPFGIGTWREWLRSAFGDVGGPGRGVG